MIGLEDPDHTKDLFVTNKEALGETFPADFMLHLPFVVARRTLQSVRRWIRDRMFKHLFGLTSSQRDCLHLFIRLLVSANFLIITAPK